MNLSSHPTDFIMTLLTQILAQTISTAIAVTIPTEARSFGPLLIFGSPVPASDAAEDIAVKKISQLYPNCKT